MDRNDHDVIMKAHCDLLVLAQDIVNKSCRNVGQSYWNIVIAVYQQIIINQRSRVNVEFSRKQADDMMAKAMRPLKNLMAGE